MYALGMAVVVVVCLKEIDINDEQPQRLLGADRLLPDAMQGLIETSSVGECGERIGSGFRLHQEADT